jgi:hypothetical protein
MPDAYPIADGAHDETVTSALLQELLGEANRIATDAHTLLAPMGVAREQLRAVLLERGLIVKIGDPDPPPISLVAVDGACVREPLYIADLMVIVATSAEGMTSTGGHPLKQSHWCEIISHESENDRVLSAAMAAHELALINQLTHELRILDGSTTSPIITLSAALNVRSSTAQDLVVDLISDDVLNSIYGIGSPSARPNPGRVVALPKSDSSDYFVRDYQANFGLALPGNDRFMAAQVLERGEMLYPRQAAEHQHLPLSIPKSAPRHVQHKAHQLSEAVTPIRDAAEGRNLIVTYAKPESADTVLKVELMAPEPLPGHEGGPRDSAALAEARLIARYLSDETPGPHMQEPFAQYAVDLSAKSVSVGADALNQAMLASLPPEADSYLPLLVRSYRTSNSGGGPKTPGSATPRPGG